MCLLSFAILEHLTEPLHRLLLDVENRDFFGIGAVPKPRRGRRIHIIMELAQKGLVMREGFFGSGHPRFALTLCGHRAAKLLQEITAHPLAIDSIRSVYDSDPCPLDLLNDEGEYHAYEHWNENPRNYY